MRARRPSTRNHDRRVMPALIAAALVLGLALHGGEVRAAAELAEGHGATLGSSDHGHACKCRMHCKTACCCAPDETTTATATRVEPVPMPDPATPATDASGPCLKASPCGGDPAVPVATPGLRVGAKAAPSTATRVRPAVAGTLIPTLPSTPPPPTAPARIDEPPEA